MVKTAESKVSNVSLECNLDKYCSKEIISSEYCTYLFLIESHKNPIQSKTNEEVTGDSENQECEDYLEKDRI